ncbi:ATP-binding protein [Nitrosococcus watsonii]|uniref:ATP-binding protein n=1 Tax=Nitrosococcus watsonii TaxID=473531 RepID=UPI0002E97AA9|nr:ATP-binding protein [Nitrosococcus watsonii]
MKKLEEVYKRSGIPTYTFVEPAEYKSLLVSIRIPGRGTIVEGPSGIGKTTSVLKIIESLSPGGNVTKLSGRNTDDYDVIAALPELGNLGIVLIDDFHRLPEETKSILADYIKRLADTENENSKIIIVGINKAGQSLLNYASDLTGRIDTIAFESNPENKVEELISKGENALNITINIKNEIIVESQGSFHLAQMLCHECCIEAEILGEMERKKGTISSMEVVRERVLGDLSKTFFEKAKPFATGPRLRKEGRAPYFFLLYWLATAKDWSLNISDAIRKNPAHRSSVSQIVDKGFLADHIAKNSELQDVIHFDSQTRELSIEDPKFVYFIRNLLWSKFCEKIGYRSVDFDSTYDYALSFGWCR